MKAVIMAGGEGTRLRPLTCDSPKPMAHLCGRPVLEYILDLLQEHDVLDAAVTMRYIPSAITAHFGDGYRQMRLSFSEEDKPLGTAGSVRLAVDSQWGGANDDVLIISGDALTDIDLSEACAFHKSRHAAATLIVTRVADPREYGLAEFDREGRITGFLEKPGWGQAATDAANTGIYILSPEALESIPADTNFDFAKDLFPLLLRDGLPLYAYETKDYWCDIGDLTTYLTCQRDILEGRVKTNLPVKDGVCMAEEPAGGYTLIPPVYIGKNVQIGAAAQIGPFAVLGDGCHIGNNAKVRGSVLLDGVYIGDRAALTGALVCHGASVRRGAALFEGAAVGEGAVIGEHAAVSPHVKIWPEKQVEAGTHLRENLREGGPAPGLFDDGGLCGETGVELTPEFCARLGAAIGSQVRGEKVAVGCSSDKAAAVMKMALTAGILSVGGLVWDFGPCIEPQFDYFVNFSLIRTGVYVSGGLKGAIRLLGAGGLPAARNTERSVEARLTGGDFSRVGWDTVREATNMTGMRQLYRQELISMAPDGLSGLSAQVRGSDYEPVRLLGEVLSTLGCGAESGPRFHLGAGGRRLSIYDPEAGYVWPERVLGVNCLLELEDGGDLALPYDAPVAIEEMAAHYGRKVRRYLSCPVEGCDGEARRLAANQPWVRDGLMQAVRLLSRMKQYHVTLAELLGRLPDFAVTTRTIPCEGNPGRILRQLRDETPEAASDGAPAEGARVRLRGGTGLVRPTKAGKNLVLVAEASSAEIAEEVCGRLEERLRALSAQNSSGQLDINRENR